MEDLVFIDKIYEKQKDIAIEQKVVASLVMNPSFLQIYSHSLSEKLFTHLQSAYLYKVIQEVGTDKQVIENSISQKNILDKTKFHSFLDVYTSDKEAFEKLLGLLVEMAQKRDLLKSCRQACIDVINGEQSAKIGESLKNGLVANYTNDVFRDRTNREILKDIYYSIAKKDQINYIKSGYEVLDSIIKGFLPGTVTILAARSSMGKSALALNIAKNIMETSKKVLFFSIEMTDVQLMQRLLALESGMNVNHIAFGGPELIGENTMPSYLEAAWKKLATSSITIDSQVSSLSGICTRARQKWIKGEVDIIVLDYLQIVKYSEKGRNREQEVSKISSTIKELAKDLNIPIIALSQLSRDNEKSGKTIRKPRMSDLRDSGNIENDADTIILLHREDYYENPTNPEQETDVIVAKGRNTGTGECKLIYIPKRTLFV